MSNTGRTDSALSVYFQVLAMEKERKDIRGIIRTANNISILYRKLGMYEQAFKYQRESLELAEKMNDIYMVGETCMGMGECYDQTGNTDKALEYYHKALELMDSLASASSLDYLLRIMAEAYRKKGNPSKALYYYKRYIQIQDSLQSDKINQMVTRFQIEYATLEKAQEIELLNRQRAIKDMKIRQQKQWLIAMITGFILLSGLTILILLLYFKKQRAYKEIVRKDMMMVRAKKNLPIKGEIIPAEEKEKSTGTKYRESAMSAEYKEKLANTFRRLMDEEKVFMDPELTLKKVAEKSGSNTLYISQMIYEVFNTNFSNLVSSYRINEARKKLLDMDSKYTIESIAYEVGFRSVSPFNRAFKTIVGVTPSFYMKSMLKERENNKIDNK